MQTLVRDTFTGPDGTLLENHAPDIGGLWVKLTGISATIQSNKLQRTTSSLASSYVNTASPARDFEMSFVISALTGGNNGFIAHRQPNGDWYFAFYSPAAGAYQIYKTVAGVSTLLVTLTEAAPSLPATFMLKVREGDEYLRLLVDGVEKVATNDATLSGGLAGILIQGFGGTTIIDDFLLERPDGTGDLPGIFDELVTIQNGITAPTGLKALTCYDEPPAGVLTFPSFVNIEAETDIKQGPARRTQLHTIDMHLLFARSDQKYSLRERRQWVKKVLDAFDVKLTLNGKAHYARIAHIDYAPVVLPGGDTEYTSATFRLSALVDAAFAYAS